MLYHVTNNSPTTKSLKGADRRPCVIAPDQSGEFDLMPMDAHSVDKLADLGVLVRALEEGAAPATDETNPAPVAPKAEKEETPTPPAAPPTAAEPPVPTGEVPPPAPADWQKGLTGAK